MQFLQQRLHELSNQQVFSLLELLISYGALDDAQAVLDDARSEGKKMTGLAELQAQVFQEKGDYAAALSILTAEYLASIHNPTVLRKLHSQRAKCLEATGEYVAALASYGGNESNGTNGVFAG